MKKVLLISSLFVLLANLVFAQSFGELHFSDSNNGLMIYGNSLYANYSLSKTTDGGGTWQSLLSAKKMKSIAQVDDQKIFVGYNSDGIAYTTDGGSSWNFNNFGKNEVKVRKIEFINSNYGWVCSEKSIFITEDGGNSWRESEVPMNVNPALSIDLRGVDNGFMVKENGAVYKYLKGNTPSEWIEIGDLGRSCYGNNAGFKFTDSSNAFAVGYSAAFKTSDGGYNWDLLNFTLYKEMHGFHVVNKNNLWICGDRGIYNTVDAGETFAKKYDGEIGIQSIYFVNSQVGWALNNDGEVLKTNDGGSSWKSGNNETSFPPTINSVEDAPADNGGYVNLSFERSQLDGIVNSQVLDRYEIYSVVHGKSIFVKEITPSKQKTYNIVLKSKGDSTSAGIVWSYFKVAAVTSTNSVYTSNIEKGYSFDNLYPNPPEILEAEYNNSNVKLLWKKSSSDDIHYYKIYRSTNEQFSIDTLDYFVETIDTTFTDSNIPNDETLSLYYKLFAVDSSGYVSEQSSNIEVPIRTTDVVDSELPKEFSLSQNYPNPFNPSTKINFSLPIDGSGYVKLKVVDILGREIITLVNKALQAGNYQVQFNGANVPSGLYFYTLSVDGKQIDVKKMLLIK